jgi:uncharacterized protein
MATTFRVPGVYRETVFLQPEARLPTGVPAFVGFADPGGTGGPALHEPVTLHRREEFRTRFTPRAGSYLEDAITGFFENGGVRCYVVRADAAAADLATALERALEALAPIEDLDLIAVPDAMTLREPGPAPGDGTGPPRLADIVRVQRSLLAHCNAQGNRIAILDSVPAATPEQVLEQRERLAIGQAEPMNGALYYPWLLRATNASESGAPGSPLNAGRAVPPCGHVAGIIARTDGKVGVFKAPANEEVFGIFDLETVVDDRVQDALNPAHVNCVRAFRGRGIRVWGARTLSRDPNWRYVNVRRLFLTLRRWIDRNMTWATFEPNEPRLWVRIQRELTTYLTTLLRAGALKGTTADQAFFVKCDAETNPPELREVGQVHTEIGLAPLSPAEFIVIRIVHRASVADEDDQDA